MAIVEPSGRIRGQIQLTATQVATKRNGKQIYRSIAKNPHHYRTIEQAKSKRALSVASAYWSTGLTPAERNEWNTYAASLPPRNRDTVEQVIKPQGGPSTGIAEYQGAFVSINRVTGSLPVAMNIKPPTNTTTPTAPIITSAIYASGVITINGTYPIPAQPVHALYVSVYAKLEGKQKAKTQEIVTVTPTGGTFTAIATGMRPGGSANNAEKLFTDWGSGTVSIQVVTWIQAIDGTWLRSASSNLVKVKLQ